MYDMYMYIHITYIYAAQPTPSAALKQDTPNVGQGGESRVAHFGDGLTQPNTVSLIIETKP